MQTKHPLILASASLARQEMLNNVGVEFQSIPADIDEAAILKDLQNKNAGSDEIAITLAEKKAAKISNDHPDAFVIGSDQILVFEDEIFQKAKTRDEAREKLKSLRGKTHHLISACVIIQNNQKIFENSDTAALTMHDFDDSFLEKYLTLAEDDILNCVGGYAYEKHGAWLFKSIQADIFTILGMPLLPLLAFLRQEGLET